MVVEIQNLSDNSIIHAGWRNLTPFGGGFNSIGGGNQNTISSGGGSVISGGLCNRTNFQYNFIGTGINNTTSGCYSTIVGGISNTTNSDYTTILGGRANTVLSGNPRSFVIGTNIVTNRQCTTFVNALSIQDIPTNSNQPSGTVWRDPATNGLFIVP